MRHTWLWKIAVLATVASLSWAAGLRAQTPGTSPTQAFMSDAQAKRLASDIKPALAQMVGDETAIGPELVDAVIATSMAYRAGPNLIWYSPIYAVVIIEHIDKYKRLYVYALGFEELAAFVNRQLPLKTNYFELRYKLVPGLIGDLRSRLERQSVETISQLHGDLSFGRKTTENRIGLLKPVVRQVDPDNVKCIKTLDKAALVWNISSELKDKNDQNWFDHMTMGDILTDEDGSKFMIFVNDATRRLHLIVPVSQQGERCIPGASRVTFIQ